MDIWEISITKSHSQCVFNPFQANDQKPTSSIRKRGFVMLLLGMKLIFNKWLKLSKIIGKRGGYQKVN